MVHHYDAGDNSDKATVVSKVLPHPEEKEVIDLTKKPKPESKPVPKPEPKVKLEPPIAPPPLTRQMATGPYQPMPMPMYDPMCPVPDLDPTIRDLALAMLASFVLGAGMATLLAFYSRGRAETDA